MLLNHTDSSLIIIDVQEKLMPAVKHHKKIIANCAALVTGAKRFDVPLVITEQYPKGLGRTVPAVGDLAQGAVKIIEKNSFSGVKHTPFKTYISETTTKDSAQLVLAGSEAHICVLQTALDLRAEGYQVFVVADAIGSRRSSSLKIALERLKMNDIQLVSTEMVLFEWIETADSAAFKDLRPLFV